MTTHSQQAPDTRHPMIRQNRSTHSSALPFSPVLPISRMAWLVALLALIAVGVMPALARPQINPNEPIDMELKDADLVQVLRSFAVIGGAEPKIADGIAGKVTVKLQSTPWAEALDSLCQRSGCCTVVG